MNQRYNDVVADYYDFEADSFEKRAGENHVLMTLRDSFREIQISSESSEIQSTPWHLTAENR